MDRLGRLTATCTLLGLLTLASQGQGDAPDAPPPAETVRREVVELLKHLDSPHYEVRRRAVERIDELVARRQQSEVLATEFQRVALEPSVSFEVRRQLARWRTYLPKAKLDPPSDVSSEEIDRLIVQLDDDSYGVRLGAAERLQWISGNAKLAGPILVRLKKRLAEPDLSAEDLNRLEPVRKAIWCNWLMGEPGQWRPAQVSQQQLERWIDDLVPHGGKPEEGLSAPAMRARQELMDLLACDDEVPRLKKALEARIARLKGSEGVVVRELAELTRPAMVAEYWNGRRQQNTQRLLVDVPSQVPGAMRPSHFDRIDDRVAHCVSGNSLSPGDYPVGVAFPHPARSDAIFHLVNLPTPRRRMAYDILVTGDAAARLTMLSRRTLDRFQADGHRLTAAETIMLAQLDPGEVSRFAGRYFECVEDGPLEEEAENRYGEGPRVSLPASLHGQICVHLALEGTREAAPGLLAAIERKRFLPPTATTPYGLPWLAALSIAQRDPWPGVDRWLAAVIEDRTELVQGRGDGPELGATAARLLLKRHNEPPGRFELDAAPESILQALHVAGFRYRTAEGPQQVRRWWEQRGGGSGQRAEANGQ